MKARCFATFFFTISFLAGFAQQSLKTCVDALISKPEYRHAQIGVHVIDLRTGETVCGLNEEKLFIPASTQKMITSATALELLEPDYRFKTKLCYRGKIRNNVLKGDLVVIGGGDPTLGSEYFNKNLEQSDFLDIWAERIQNAGIRFIEGNLIFDGSIYDDETIPDTWIWEDIGNYYGAGASPFSVYDNLYRITFSSPKKAGEKTTITHIYPEMNDLEIDNRVLSSDVNRDMAYVFGSPLDSKRVIRGTIPENRKSFTIKAANHHPEKLLASQLLEKMAKHGIFIKGEIIFEKTPHEKIRTIYIHESPALKEIIKVTNYESVNLFAEHLLKQLSAEKNGKGSRAESIKILKDFWQEKGLDTAQFFMEDGSGLSHFNAVSPVFFTSLLKFMATVSPDSAKFIYSLPPAGEGTLQRFSPTNFPGNTLRAKSGSMTRVRAFCGYLTSDSGNQYAFSILVNHFPGSFRELDNTIENLLVRLREK